MSDVIVEKKKKHTGLKVCVSIVAILLVIVIIGIIIINIMVKPVDDKSDKAVPVGGLLTSSEVNYKSEKSEGLENNLILKIMQIVWKSCDASDKKNHSTQTPPSNVVKVKDLEYINDGNPYHKLDVFYPEGKIDKEGLPVIIDIHGGGWMYATKDLNEYYCMELASRGYVVFSISYRLVPDVTVGEQLQDCCEALRWISKNIKNYPTNPETICLTGDSAGGQMAAYSAILAQNEEAREIFEVVDPEINIDCMVLTSPVAFMKKGGMFSVYTKPLWGKNYKDNNTYNYMDISEMIPFVDEMPATYFITSSGDSLAHDQTVTAYNLFVENGYTCELHDFDEVEGKKLEHVFSVLNPFDTAGQMAIDEFVNYFQKTLLMM